MLFRSLQVLSMFDRDVPRRTARAAGWRIDTEDEIRSRSTCDIANANQRGLPGAVILPYVQNAHDNKLTASMKALVTQPYLTDTSQSPEQRAFSSNSLQCLWIYVKGTRLRATTGKIFVARSQVYVQRRKHKSVRLCRHGPRAWTRACSQ